MSRARDLPPSVIIFAKAPVPGRCKTRLAPRFGPVLAARLYRAMTEQIVADVVAIAPGPVWLACGPDTRHVFFKQLARRYGVRRVRQARGDLGQRMGRELAHARRRGAGAFVIGTDQPVIDTATLGVVFEALEHAPDMIMAPTDDGGYWLIGGHRIERSVFRGIDWSTTRVAGQTRMAMRRRRLSWAEGPRMRDIDEPRDWSAQPRGQRSQLLRWAIMPGRRRVDLSRRTGR